MGCANARSRQISRPDGVVNSFQVSRYKIEPRPASRACNLFAKDALRATLADEPEELRPQVSLVIESAVESGDAERLAGTATGPRAFVIGDTREPQRIRPTADPSEEMTR